MLLIEALLLVLAAVTGKSTLSILAPMVIAMGVQNAAIDKEHATRMGLSYVTGTLVSFGDKLADALRPHGPARWAWAPHRLHWGALVLGAICGALGYRDWGASALLAPACAAAVLAGITAVTGA